MGSHDIAPVLGMFVMVLPIIVIVFSRHQQKMAMILRQSPSERSPAVEQLSREIRDLKDLAISQALAIDRIETALQKRSAPDQDKVLQERVS